MPTAKFLVESKTSGSFRASQVKAMFDCNLDAVVNSFDVDIPIENKKWNIGLIVGASGTGKTTIAKKVFDNFIFFEGYDWKGESVIDSFDQSISAKKITEALSKVGFSSPPDWLKPFNILSNGQKMRAELARVALESNRPFIYDEFTSVADRQAAKIGSAAIQKYIRKEDKQFIAISCHYDVECWLEPDWVYCCNTMTFKWRSLRRPYIGCNIRQAEKSEWALFKKFHYLSGEHHNAAHSFVCEIDNKAVAWCSVLHFPHPDVKNFKKIHRLVVLPEYQGIGIGIKLLNEIAAIYKDKGFRVIITTGSSALSLSLIKKNNWVMTRRPSFAKLSRSKTKSNYNNTISTSRLTASFEFIDSNEIIN
jgi:GNAT superfamily N-acetyltransferase/ABC-type iron transport system FetAB ATPase subunit